VKSSQTGNAVARWGHVSEFIAQQLYPNIKREDLTEEQRQTISSLSTLAAGLPGGLTGDSSADAVAGAQAGKNALENNSLLLPGPVPVPVPGLPLSTGDKVVQDANNKMASELGKALKGSGTEEDTPPITDGQSIVDGRNEAAKSRDPNVAKDLTDAEKAEVGGTGSGTPGGWGPEDEEKARNSETGQNNDAHSSTSGKDLNSELAGEEISNGHAFDKHVIEQGEFKELGISTKEQFAAHIEKVVRDPTSSKNFSGGRTAYWDESSGAAVIRNPNSADGGTAFRPTNGRAYYDNLR